MTSTFRPILVTANGFTAFGPTKRVDSLEEALAVVADWIDKYPSISINPDWIALKALAEQRISDEA